jgi:hypothetical protein
LLLVDFRRISAFVELRLNGVLRSSPQEYHLCLKRPRSRNASPRHEDAHSALKATRTLLDTLQIRSGLFLAPIQQGTIVPSYASNLEAAPIGWQLFALGSSRSDWIAFIQLIVTYATRLLAQAFSQPD